MAITSTLTTSFKKQLLEGTHNFKNSGGNTFKLALYTSSATLGATTTDIAGLTSLVVDSITINGSTLSTTAGNTDIVFSPHGTGTVTVPSGYEDRAGFTTNSLANKAYIDQVAQGLDANPSARAATTANISGTYSNGTAGVGATITAGSFITVTASGSGYGVGDVLTIPTTAIANLSAPIQITLTASNLMGATGQGSSQFEIDETAQTSVVLGVLKYTGIILNDTTVMQAANGLQAMDDQNAKK